VSHESDCFGQVHKFPRSASYPPLLTRPNQVNKINKAWFPNHFWLRSKQKRQGGFVAIAFYDKGDNPKLINLYHQGVQQ
jgi:hypothetical protein